MAPLPVKGSVKGLMANPIGDPKGSLINGRYNWFSYVQYDNGINHL